MSEFHGNISESDDDLQNQKIYDLNLLKKIWGFFSAYKKLIFLSLLILPFIAVLQLSQPYIIKLTIDKHIIKGDLKGINFLALAFLGALTTQYLLTFIQQYILQLAGQKVIQDLRIKLFTHLQKMPYSFFDKNPVGGLVSRVTNDVESLSEMFTAGIAGFAGDFFILIGIIIVMLKLNAKLALVTFIVVPLLAVVAVIFRTKSREANRIIRTKLSDLNTFLNENITGAEIVKLFNREKKNLEKFKKINGEYLAPNIKSVYYDAFLYAFVELIGSVAVALIIWFGGGQIIRQTLTFGALVAFIEYVEKFFRPIRDLSTKYAIMQQAMASSERIFNLLEEKEEVFTGKRKIDNLQGEIVFKNVYFSYNPDNDVLKDVNFRINPGEKIAIVGATGAGKSTIIKLLSRFYDIEKGEIRLDGVDIKELDKLWLRKQVGIVLQDVFLFSGDIMSNIRLGETSIKDSEVIEACRLVNAHNFISKLPNGYYESVKELGKNFSSGEKQLLSFARALVFNPKILVLDEATSSVDTVTENIIQEALFKLMEGRTSIIIAHRLSTIQRADRIIVLHKGLVKEVGTHRELMNLCGIYYKLYQLQYKYHLEMTAL